METEQYKFTYEQFEEMAIKFHVNPLSEKAEEAARRHACQAENMVRQLEQRIGRSKCENFFSHCRAAYTLAVGDPDASHGGQHWYDVWYLVRMRLLLGT
jgi:hypothetical protein